MNFDGQADGVVMDLPALPQKWRARDVEWLFGMAQKAVHNIDGQLVAENGDENEDLVQPSQALEEFGQGSSVDVPSWEVLRQRLGSARKLLQVECSPSAPCLGDNCCNNLGYCGTGSDFCNAECIQAGGGSSAPSSCRPSFGVPPPGDSLNRKKISPNPLSPSPQLSPSRKKKSPKPLSPSRKKKKSPKPLSPSTQLSPSPKVGGYSVVHFHLK